jgi:hypothetical protein
MTRYIKNETLQKLYDEAKVDGKENSASGLCNMVLCDMFRSGDGYIVYPQFTQDSTRPDFRVGKYVQGGQQVTVKIVEAKSALSSQSYTTAVNQMKNAIRDAITEYPAQRGMWGAVWKGTEVDVYYYQRPTDQFHRMTTQPLDIKVNEGQVYALELQIKARDLF